MLDMLALDKELCALSGQQGFLKLLGLLRQIILRKLSVLCVNLVRCATQLHILLARLELKMELLAGCRSPTERIGSFSGFVFAYSQVTWSGSLHWKSSQRQCSNCRGLGDWTPTSLCRPPNSGQNSTPGGWVSTPHLNFAEVGMLLDPHFLLMQFLKISTAWWFEK